MPKILVIIDPEEKVHFALERIKEIPVKDADINVVYYYKGLPASASQTDNFQQGMEDKKRWLKDLVAPLAELGYKVETQVSLFNRLYEAIITSANNFNADFIFKPLRQHNSINQMLFTSTDWNLIRFCPTPLLLVSPSTSVKNKPVMAALDLSSQDDAHIKLNQAVLEQSKLIANVLNSDIHLVNAYSLTVMASEGAAIEPMAYQVSREGRDALNTKAVSIANEHNLNVKNIHIREGAPDQVVNECAVEFDAGVIVLGTVARSGVAGLFIGNTAEALIEKTQCDVFVVKHDKFKSPI